MSVEDSPQVHGDCVVCKNKKKALCVVVKKATHGMLISALPFHMKFRDDSELMGFKFNCCDACMATLKNSKIG